MTTPGVQRNELSRLNSVWATIGTILQLQFPMNEVPNDLVQEFNQLHKQANEHVDAGVNFLHKVDKALEDQRAAKSVRKEGLAR